MINKQLVDDSYFDLSVWFHFDLSWSYHNQSWQVTLTLIVKKKPGNGKTFRIIVISADVTNKFRLYNARYLMLIQDKLYCINDTHMNNPGYKRWYLLQYTCRILFNFGAPLLSK